MTEQPRIFVKASPGCRIKDPYTMIVLKEEGEWKPAESYWWRKILCGDCFQAEPPKEEEEAKSEDVSVKKKHSKKTSNESEE